MPESKYDKIPISEPTKAGTSLNVNDLIIIKRMFDLQDDCIEEQFNTIITKLDSQNILILEMLTMIKAIQEKLCDHEKRLTWLEKEVKRLSSEIKKVA